MNWLPTNLEPVPSYLHAGRTIIRKGNNQIRILKGRYSNQIYQIRESIMKFLNKETGTLGERIRTLFKEQGIMIVSISTALGMTLGVLVGALLGGTSGTTTTSESTTTSD